MQDQQLRPDAIGLPRIIFFVIAAAAPLAAALGAVPIAIGFGNGAGVPITFVAVGLLLALFSIGYGRMTARIRNAGAFYAYVAHGIGPAAGLGAAFVAIASYTALQIGLYGLLGYYCTTLFSARVHWSLYAVATLLLVHLFGRRGVELNGALLGILMIVESLVILLLGAAIIAHGGGPDGLTLRMFDPAFLFAPGSGVALIFALACFIGFEATAIYAEEARRPERTVPLATFGAVAVITLFFTFVSWTIICAHGLAHAQADARADPGAFWFSVSDRLLGPWASPLMSLLLLGSSFASILAFHNMIVRYLFALGRDGQVWRGLAVTHPVHRSPQRAGLLQSLSALAVLALCAGFGADPYVLVFGWGGAFGTIGIMALQLLVCVAVIGYFGPRREEPRWPTIVAPAASALGLALILVQALRNLSLLGGGSESPWLRFVPWIHLALFAIGLGYASLTRRKREAAT
jgi:amino acid transporter